MKYPLPHPLAVLVSSLLTAASIESHGISIWTVLMFGTFLWALDLAMQTRGISKQRGDEAISRILLAFARHLGSMSPRDAFVTSYVSSPIEEKPLLNGFLAIRDGTTLPTVMRYLSRRMPFERALFEALSALISFDAASAGDRLRSYANLRKERVRMRAELDTKLMVISMRFKLLSAISSASQAVIAFASPLLKSFFVGNRIHSSAGIESILHFDLGSFLVSYSMVLACSYLPTKVLPFASGSRSVFYSSVSYFLAYLALVLVASSGF